MRKLLHYIVLISLFSIIRTPYSGPDYFITPPSEPSIATSEDPKARADYEVLLTADPQTGQIPTNIRAKELAFAQTLPRKENGSSSQLRTEVDEFRKAGPFNIGGRTRAVAFDIRNDQTILAGGVSGGIWRTTNEGITWTRTSDPKLRNSVTALVQDTRPQHENTWYFGTGELVGNSARSVVSPFRGGGIYKSTDNGQNWTLLTSTIDNATPDNFTSMFQYIWNLEINENNNEQEELLAAAFGGILRSTDGGESWNTILGEQLFGLDVTDLNCSVAPFFTNVHQTASGILFATLSSATSASRNGACEEAYYTNAGVYYSLNGTDWVNITPAFLPEQYDRTVIGSNASGDEIYFLTSGELPSLLKFEVISRSDETIQGNWKSLPYGIPKLGGEYGDYNSQDSYNMLVAVHPEQNNVVFVGGTNLYRSTDGFNSPNRTDWIGGYSPANNASQYEGHHADQHLLLFYPNNPNEMLSASDGGLIKSNNNLRDTVEWHSLNNGFVTSQFYSINQRQDATTNEIIGGMQDNGSWFRDAPGENPSWNRVLGGDGGYAAVSPNADYRYVSFQNSQIYRVSIGDDYKLKAFARVDPIGGGTEEPYLFINPYQLDPKNGNIMFLTGGNHLWRNHNLAQIPGGVQKSTSVGWSRIASSKLLQANYYSCLTISSSDDVVYAGISGLQPGLSKITNASNDQMMAASIVQDSMLFPSGAHLSSIAIHPTNSDHILVTLSNYNSPSIFESLDGGNTFIDISGNLEQYPDGGGNGPSVRWAQIVPTTSGYEYYVGTSIGLYSTSVSAGGNTIWFQNSPDEIGNSVVVMMDYRTLDGRMVVATHGNGTFEKYLENVQYFDPTPDITADLSFLSYPNPFQDKTTLSYSLPQSHEVVIDLFDAGGRLVRNLIFAPQYAGDNKIEWDGLNNAGIPVKPGIYFCTLYYAGEKRTQRIIRLPL
ncbi:FlgD immunoglobulin-like domain containing protein [Marinoscillum sp.]|uniref:FlgD immunoglobulin-like domain containing protein n=1 Tax=Marinoscillum sp. TaxID=2024838 RepID=UPI003BA941E9